MTQAHLPEWWAQLTQTMPRALQQLRAGIYGSGGAPFHHAALVALWGGQPLPVRAEDIQHGVLAQLDVLIFPGGGMKAMAGMLDPLGTGGAEAVRRWVAAGGLYLGSCAGAFLPATVGQRYWSAHEEARRLHMVHAVLANGSDSPLEGLTSPGVGALKVAREMRDHWLLEGLPERFDLVHYNGPLFDLAAPDETALPVTPPPARPEGLLWPTAATSTFTPSEAFLDAAPAVMNATLLDRCIARGAYNGIVAHYGRGLVVLFGSHPEFGFDVLQLGWGPGVRLLANALRYQSTRRPTAIPTRSEAGQAPINDSAVALDTTLNEVAGALYRISHSFIDLRDAHTGAWLEPGSAPSFLGRTPSRLWHEAADTAARTAEEAASLARRVLNSGLSLDMVAQWIDDPPRPNQDVGFMGLKQLVLRIEAGLEAAQQQLAKPPVALNHAYEMMDAHPYQLAVSSYLSAAGLTAAALLSATTLATLIGLPQAVPMQALLQAGTLEEMA